VAIEVSELDGAHLHIDVEWKELWLRTDRMMTMIAHNQQPQLLFSTLRALAYLFSE
jgi:hypothetical protein